MLAEAVEEGREGAQPAWMWGGRCKDTCGAVSDEVPAMNRQPGHRRKLRRATATREVLRVEK
eukprot:6913785-Pyramimonas_sp.AAC.1